MAGSDKVMLFDGDCGFCTTSAGLIGRLGTAYEMVPWQRWPHLAEHGISRERVDEEIHVVDGEQVYVAQHAVAHVLASSRHRFVRLAGRVLDAPGVSPVAGRAYHWIGAHRHQLPGGTPACARPAAR